MNAPIKPQVLAPAFDAIHPDLTVLPQWVMWLLTNRDGKWTKRPVTPSGAPASSTDPATWSSFEECRQAYESGGDGGKFSGVGFVTCAADPFVLIDLDHVVDETGIITPWAQEIVNAAKAECAYVETSISGGGIHIIGRAPPLEKGSKRNDAELYSSGRFFTMSGLVHSSPNVIGELSSTVDLTLQRIGDGCGLTKPQSPSAQAGLSSERLSDLPVDDETLLSMARSARNGAKFCKLFDKGDITDYGGDDSRADLALAAMLAFWTGNAPAHIERLMRQSKLARDKWDRHPTYLRHLTITKALANMTAGDFYDWSKHQDLNDPAAAKFIQSPKGGLMPVLANVNLILLRDPDLLGLFRFDEFAQRMLITRPTPGRASLAGRQAYPRPARDSDALDLLTFLQRNWLPTLTRELVEQALLQYQPDVSFHPVRDYLSGLVWDGQPRLDTWLVEYLDADCADGMGYLEQVGAKFLIAAVARIFRPGCKADNMIVLEGEQNLGKSTILLTLAGEHWFSDCLPADLGAKDAMVHLQGKWICEMPELSQLKRSEVETIKAFVSRRTDKFRPPYGRQEHEYPRQCVFAGTTNSDRYLVDETGNRRFWVIKVGKCDLERLRADRDQLWAEATQRYESGEAWYLDHEDAKTAAAVAADARTVDDPWISEVAEILKREAQRNLEPNEIRAITPGEVLKKMLDVPLTQCTKSSAARVAGLMGKLGWAKHKRDRTRGMLYVPNGAPDPQ